MKKIILIAILLLSFIAKAQESFPNKHPELLIGKEVTIVPTMDSEISGYSNFYTDSALRVHYEPVKENSTYTKTDVLLGKQFKVTAVDSIKDNRDNKYARITLQPATGPAIYFNYVNTVDFRYPFEVKGGLTLPAGFYCDYVEKKDYGTFTNYESLVGIGTRLMKVAEANKSTYSLSFAIFDSHGSNTIINTVLLVLDNGQHLTFNNMNVYPAVYSATSYKYEFTVILKPKDIIALKGAKLIGVKVGDSLIKISFANKLRGVLTCMDK